MSDAPKFRPLGLRLEIFPAIEGVRVRVGLGRRHHAMIVRVNWVPNRSGRWKHQPSEISNQRDWLVYEAATWSAAYRAACRAIESIGNLSTRAALLRAVTPIPLAELKVLEIWNDMTPDSRNERQRVMYCWRFVGNKAGAAWDVEVDERFRGRFRGIAPYIDNFHD